MIEGTQLNSEYSKDSRGFMAGGGGGCSEDGVTRKREGREVPAKLASQDPC